VRNNKGFFRYVNQKRKAKDIVPLLVNKTGDLVTTGMEKDEVINNFFASVFTGNCCSLISQKSLNLQKEKNRAHVQLKGSSSNRQAFSIRIMPPR